AWRALGPNGREVAAFIERVPSAAWDAAGNAARDAAWDAARDAVWNAAGTAAWYAARALVVRDLITPQQFAALVEPWRLLTGEDLQ
ncbi:MAG TPA: hypothetical protein VN088_07740, partial [Nocardioides sp.]|nr:hypothetical protein [Nocardioides sp.]